METLTSDQRKVLAEFCANFAVAWSAAGVVAPLIAGKGVVEIITPKSLMSVGWTIFFLGSAAFLVKGK